MREHLTPQRIDRGRKWCLRIRSAVAVEPGGECIATKLPYHVVMAACGETRKVALHPVFNGRLAATAAMQAHLAMEPNPLVSLPSAKLPRGSTGGPMARRRIALPRNSCAVTMATIAFLLKVRSNVRPEADDPSGAPAVGHDDLATAAIRHRCHSEVVAQSNPGHSGRA
jgi:hypothetical protein